MLGAVPDRRLLYSAHGKALFSLTSRSPRGSLRDSAAASRDPFGFCGLCWFGVFTMRKYLGLAVLAGALVAGAGACGNGNKGAGGDGRITNPGKGSGASGGAGPGSFNFAGGLNIDPGTITNNGGAPTDVDPGNPNVAHAACQAGNCKDFPEAAILAEGVPANAPTLFGAADNFSQGSLCVLEPQLSAGGKPGAMMPANWVRPRFRVAGVPAGIDVLEIRIHSPVEANDLVAYTKYTATGGVAPSWYLPKEIWTGAVTATSPAS